MGDTAKEKGLNRRDFHCAALAGAAGLAAGEGAAADDAESKGQYIDVHTHIGQRWGVRPPLTVEGLLRWMDANGIAKAVVLPLVSPEAWDHPVTTDYVLEETKPHRDRLIPFCAIDPRNLYLKGVKTKVERLEKYRDAGAKGFGEHKAAVKMDDPRNLELFHACAEVGLPVLFHLDTIRNVDEPGLPRLEKVLQEVPGGVFIGHAQGWWASVDKDVKAEEMQGYPKSGVTPGGTVDRLMDNYPNIYGDISAGSGANAFTRDPAFGRGLLVRRADRLLFGTDYLRPGQDVAQLTLLDQFDLPVDIREKIAYKNAERVLSL